MNRSALLDQISTVIADVLDIDKPVVTMETAAESFEGWDSLAHISIVGQIESEFGVKFTLAELAEFSTVGDIVEAIERKRNGG